MKVLTNGQYAFSARFSISIRHFMVKRSATPRTKGVGTPLGTSTITPVIRLSSGPISSIWPGWTIGSWPARAWVRQPGRCRAGTSSSAGTKQPGSSAWPGVLVSDGYALYRKWIHGRQTCRLQGKSTYTSLGEAMECYFKEQQPDPEWIRQAA